MDLNQNQKHTLLRFQKFISSRNKISLLLSVVILVCYYAFILSVGLFPDVLGLRLGESSISLGIIWGMFIIVLSIIVTGFYTFIANQYLDEDQEQILKELEQNGLTQHLQSGELKLNYDQKEK